MTALTSICYFCVNNSSFMIVIVSGRKYVSSVQLAVWAFHLYKLHLGASPVSSWSLCLPRLLFGWWAPVLHTPHGAEGNTLVMFQALGSVLESLGAI